MLLENESYASTKRIHGTYGGGGGGRRRRSRRGFGSAGGAASQSGISKSIEDDNSGAGVVGAVEFAVEVVVELVVDSACVEAVLSFSLGAEFDVELSWDGPVEGPRRSGPISFTCIEFDVRRSPKKSLLESNCGGARRPNSGAPEAAEPFH